MRSKVVMFSRKCSASNFISKMGKMGRDPKKGKKQKTNKKKKNMA